jgi:hypothetical protein
MNQIVTTIGSDRWTTATSSAINYQYVYPTWPTPYVIQGENVSKFEQAFKVATKLVELKEVKVPDVEAFVKLVKAIQDEL